MKYFKTVILFLLYSSLYATPVRIIGMGSLDLIIEDESNRINLFDYGKNVAGLYGDENGSSIETCITHGNIKNSDSSGAVEPEITYWGFYLPTDTEITLNTFSSTKGIPSGVLFTHRKEEEYAFSGFGTYSTTKAEYESSDIEEKVLWPTGDIIFSRNFGIYSSGIEGGYKRIKITNNQDNTEIFGTLKGFNIGGAAHLSPLLDFGISGGLTFPDIGLNISNIEYTFSGNAFSMGVQSVLKVPGLLRLGMKLDVLNANLNGSSRRSAGGVSVIGEARQTDFNFGSRLLFSSVLFPLKIGAKVNYKRTNSEGAKILIFDFDNSLSVTNLGLGVSYEMPFFTPGLQYNLYKRASTDNLDDEKTNSSFWDIRFGGEFNLTPVTLRAGFIIAKDDPNKDREEDESKSRSITLGAGIQLPLQPFKFEVAYVNKETKPVHNPTEQKEVDNSIYTAFKLKF